MKKNVFVFVLAALAVLAAAPAFAVEVPGVTPVDFGGGEPAEANPLWLILAGQGPWGAAIMGIAALLYKMFRPAVLAWLAEKKLERLFLVAESSAALMNVTYVEGMKKANADGKLTEDEKKFVFAQCKAQLVQIMKTQGLDIIKEYGDDLVNGVIEVVVSRLNVPAPLKAVARPLPGSESAPLPEL